MTEASPLPAQIGENIAALAKGLVPSSIKAIDRLVGGVIDIPAAWLAQHKARIEAQTKAYAAVEAAIAKSAAESAGADPEIIDRAMAVLVHKSYRTQKNRELVAKAAVEDLLSEQNSHLDNLENPDLIEDDWLNVFERYAENASSERMQKLWARVLSGEIRKPGKFSLRTLRFL